MRIHKILQRRIHAAINGVEYSGDVNAAVAANVGERSQATSVHSRSTADTSSKHVTETTSREEGADDGGGAKQ
jgi:hypothetical protein